MTAFRETAINNIVSDIQSKVSISNGYNTNIIKIYNYYIYPHNVSQYPSLIVYPIGDMIESEGNQHMQRRLQIVIGGVCNTISDMYNLSEDMEYFINSHSSNFIYKESIQPGEGLSIDYGQSKRNTDIFTFDFSFYLKYMQNLE